MKKVIFAALALTLGMTNLGFASGTKEADKSSDGSMMKSDDTMMKADDTMMKADDSMMKADDSMMKADSSMMDASAYDVKGLGKQVVAFTSEAAAQSLAKNQTVVYFFAATWCPDCQATYRDIKANFSKIPMNLTVVFVNYDKSTDLKKKYGITSQHSFVVIGAMGDKKKVWNGSTTVSDLVASATMM